MQNNQRRAKRVFINSFVDEAESVFGWPWGLKQLQEFLAQRRKGAKIVVAVACAGTAERWQLVAWGKAGERQRAEPQPQVTNPHKQRPSKLETINSIVDEAESVFGALGVSIPVRQKPGGATPK